MIGTGPPITTVRRPAQPSRRPRPLLRAGGRIPPAARPVDQRGGQLRPYGGAVRVWRWGCSRNAAARDSRQVAETICTDGAISLRLAPTAEEVTQTQAATSGERRRAVNLHDSQPVAAKVVELPPIAVNAKGAGRLFSLSERTWRRLNSGGLCPAPIRVGRSKRWRVCELEQWSHCGSPTRVKWEQMRQQRLG